MYSTEGNLKNLKIIYAVAIIRLLYTLIIKKVFEFTDTLLIVSIHFSEKCKQHFCVRSNYRSINSNVKVCGIRFEDESEKV